MSRLDAQTLGKSVFDSAHILNAPQDLLRTDTTDTDSYHVDELPEDADSNQIMALIDKLVIGQNGVEVVNTADQNLSAATGYIEVVRRSEKRLLSALGIEPDEIKKLSRSNGNFGDIFLLIEKPYLHQHTYSDALRRQISTLHHSAYYALAEVQGWKQTLREIISPDLDLKIEGSLKEKLETLQRGILALISRAKSVVNNLSDSTGGIDQGLQLYFAPNQP